jgi:AmmeMemoRadiSam system protein B
VTRLDLRNSGDTSGERQRVVGYGAWAFTVVEGEEHR